MKFKFLLFQLVSAICFTSCQKDFLEKKTDQSLVVPTTVGDFQGLLDNNTIMNISPSLPIVSADEYYVTDTYYQTAVAVSKNAYTWAANIFDGAQSPDWNNSYKQVFYANVILDGISNKSEILTVDEKNVQGAALFFRALGHYQLSQEFCKPYSLANSGSDPGIPLRITADVNAIAARGTVVQSYDRIVSDLIDAVPLLPDKTNYKTRPTKKAALALLARVYLSMQRYEEARKAANDALIISAELIDYNKLTANLASATNPFPKSLPNGNDEVIFFSQTSTTSILGSTVAFIDTTLYKSYAANDLRSATFFVRRANGLVNFKGTYAGSGLTTLFSGLANDELYLISAECNARNGQVAEALEDLNKLLIKRWKTGTFTAVTANNADEALAKILLERKKELIFRNLRWSDLRRLNMTPNHQITLKRILGSTSYQLLPNDKRYVFPIPDNEIGSSGIPQNPR